MSDEKRRPGYPESDSTRGATRYLYNEEVDKPTWSAPFRSLDRRVHSLEERLGRVDERLADLKLGQQTHSQQMEVVSKGIERLVGWLDGRNGQQGFKVDFVRFEETIKHLQDSQKRGASLREKILWSVAAVVGTAILGVIGKVFLDAVQRGVVSP